MQPSEAISRAAIKAYITRRLFKTADAYELHAWAYMRAFFTGEVDAFGFIDLMAAEIDNQLWRGWREGAESVGVYPEDFEDIDNAVIESAIGNEQDYLDGIAGDIEAFIAEGGHTDEEFNARFRQRAVLWARGYQTAVDKAKLHFGSKEKLEWVMGATEDHCETGRDGKPGIGCANLSGMVLWAREWNEAGVVTGGNMLNCGGWQCGCSQVVTTKRRTYGGLAKLLDMMTAASV